MWTENSDLNAMKTIFLRSSRQKINKPEARLSPTDSKSPEWFQEPEARLSPPDSKSTFQEPEARLSPTDSKSPNDSRNRKPDFHQPIPNHQKNSISFHLMTTDFSFIKIRNSPKIVAIMSTFARFSYCKGLLVMLFVFLSCWFLASKRTAEGPCTSIIFNQGEVILHN